MLTFCCVFLHVGILQLASDIAGEGSNTWPPIGAHAPPVRDTEAVAAG